MRRYGLIVCVALSAVAFAQPTGKIEKNKSGYYTAVGTFPLLPRTVVQGMAATGFETIVKDRVNKFLGFAAEDLTEKPRAPWDHQSFVTLTMNSATLVSGMATHYEYTGGAHPNTTYTCRTYGMKNGKAQRLRLTDICKPNSKPHAQVQAVIFGKLVKNEQATWVQEGTISGMEPIQFDSFVVRKDGIEWVFAPYEMGPYAAGTVLCKLKWSEIPGLDHNGPLAHLIK